MSIDRSTITPRRINIPSRQWSLLLLSWLVAFVAGLGSLFFSEIMKLEPCVLCWYQRIAMFPLVPILAIGLYSQDSGCIKYAMPLTGTGWLAAFYHWLLYSGYIPKGLQPCGKGLSCAEVSLELGGLVTIPMLSLTSFTIITILLLLANRKGWSQ
jgi:disulfide bond formation protein DsbB